MHVCVLMHATQSIKEGLAVMGGMPGVQLHGNCTASSNTCKQHEWARERGGKRGVDVTHIVVAVLTDKVITTEGLFSIRAIRLWVLSHRAGLGVVVRRACVQIEQVFSSVFPDAQVAHRA